MCSLLQATKLSAAAAASKVQLSFTTAALKSQQTLEKKLHTKLAKLQSEEEQHKQTVAERHEQLRQLQEEQAAADAQLAAARQAADDEAGAANLSAAARAGKRGKRKGAAGSAGNEGGDKQAVPTELQLLLRQLAAAETELAELQGVQSAAASKATRAAAAVAGLQASLEDIETAAANSAKQMQQAALALQQAGADLEVGRATVQEAEQAWKDAHMQQRTIQVCTRGLCCCLQSNTVQVALYLVGSCVAPAWRSSDAAS
jgi:chromosome segregation ATPase